MNTTPRLLFTVLALIACVAQAAAQGTRFFRISGAAATAIIVCQGDGTIVWSNAQPGSTYTVQTSSLPGGTNWVDYVQIPTTNNVNTNQIIDFNTPAEMVFIPAGSFTMGDTLDADSDAIPTNVYVSAFYMDENLVSCSKWQAVYTWARSNGYHFDNSGSFRGTNYPVGIVDWYDAVKWSNARSQMAGLAPVYFTDAGRTQIYTNGQAKPVYPNWAANGYRLPTEAEWEKAARGGLSGHRFPWGDTISENQANYYSFWSGDVPYYPYDVSTTSGYNPSAVVGGLPYTSRAGYFGANGYGLKDMAGNLFEWCWDWYGTPYGQPTAINPTGPESGIGRVLRGGAWDTRANYARCASRGTLNYGPAVSSYDSGFRCARAF